VRIFRSDDGAEIREEDVLKIRLRLWDSKTHEAACRIDAALTPKTCGAVLPCVHDSDNCRHPHPCVLSPGHHPFVAEGSGGSWPSRTCLICDNLPENPLHSPGHMTAPKCWHES
jgi:hypothetical protein